MPTLYLIDGYAQFFRAYHAIRTPMSSPVTREPTNLTFGFIGMMLKLLRGEGRVGGRPDYVAVALDVSGDRGTFRSQIYPEYKATRPPPPEDLPIQVERCLRTLEAIGVPIIGSEGYEADDVIATIVDRLRDADPPTNIRIISKDKDLKQLLSHPTSDIPHPTSLVELYDIHTDLVTDAAALELDTGIKPSQVIDMLALMGDTVDNVPGVDGVGPKTAAQLIAQYGSLDNLIAHADEIKGKRGESLRAAIPQLALSKQLVTLHHDAPITFDLPSADTRKLNLEALLPILRELGFNRYQDEVRALLGNKPSPELSRSVTPPEPVSRAPAPPSLPAPPAPPKRPTAPDPLDSGLFSSLASTSTPIAPRKAQSGIYRCIRTRAELDALIADMRAAEVFAVDTETTSLSPHQARLCGISISTKVGTGAYIPVLSPSPSEHLDQLTVLDALRPILEDPHKPKCGHNLKYDALIFRNQGIRLQGFLLPLPEGQDRSQGLPTSSGPPHPALKPPVRPSPLFDSMVASYLIDATRSSHSLDALALALLNRTNISIKELLGSAAGGAFERTFDTVPLELATEYAAEDADVSLQLREIMLPQLRAMGLMPLFSEVEMPLVEVLAELEWNGITVDPAELDRQRSRLQTRIDLLRKQLNEESMRTIGRTFNPDSPKQLATILFNKPTDDEPGLGLKATKKLKTGYSTDSEVLEKLADDPTLATPIPRLILEHRELTKLVGTYLVALKDAIDPKTRRIHSSFNQTVAATGRLASSDPNLQNIPIRTEIGREIRRAFVAAPDHVLISADYSQIELRLLAHLSRDPALIEAFRAGEDIHTAVAAQIHNIPLDQVTRDQRSGAKMVNFGIVYGITAFGLARRLDITNTAAEEIIRGYKKRFAGITTFLQECVDQAQRHGYVQTMLGRRRPIPDIDSTNPSRRAFAERTAINTVVQGSAADLIKLAMIDIEAGIEVARQAGNKSGVPRPLDASMPSSLRMLLQIHDELVFESPRNQAAAAQGFIVTRMENAMQLSVPLKADSSIANNWFDGK